MDEVWLILDALEGKQVTIVESGRPIQIILKANPQLRAMVFLALNDGVGNTDVGDLQFTNLDTGRGWINFPRPKTEMPRQFPLWKETLAAMKAHLVTRRQATNDVDDDCVFLNRAGARMIQQHQIIVTKNGEEDGMVEDVKV